MFWFYLDAHKFLSDKVKDKNFGGNLSVRNPHGSKILFSFGHDKLIYN